jgi:hypothetical protein
LERAVRALIVDRSNPELMTPLTNDGMYGKAARETPGQRLIG